MVADIFEDSESSPKKFLATSLCTTGTNAPWQVTIVRAEISEVKFRFRKISEVYCRKLIRYSCKAALKLYLFQRKVKTRRRKCTIIIVYVGIQRRKEDSCVPSDLT